MSLSQSLIKNWTLLLSRSVICQWRQKDNLGFEQWSEPTICELIIDNPEGLIASILENPSFNISRELNLLIERIKLKKNQKAPNYFSILTEAKLKIEKWISEYGLPKIYLLSQDLRFSEADKLEKKISSFWQQLSPQSLIEYFKNLLRLIRDSSSEYERKKLECIQKENEAWRAFSQLSSLLSARTQSDQKNNSLKNQQHLFESACNAIAVGFKYKLEIEAYVLIEQLIVRLIQLCQSYFDMSLLTDRMLEQIQHSIEKQLNFEFTSLPILDKLEQVDAERYKLELEVYIGHSLNRWGVSPSLSWRLIEEQLINKIYPLAEVEYIEFTKAMNSEIFGQSKLERSQKVEPNGCEVRN